jgi:hypothetical protein
MSPDIAEMTDRELLEEVVSTLREARAVVEGMSASPMMGMFGGMFAKKG